MRFTRVTGPAFTAVCHGCGEALTTGTEPYRNSQGKLREPEEGYTDGERIYDAECAAKLKETDPALSVNLFFLDTEGTQIDYR